jgi:predicted acylesterase/phospholipase RssA
MLDVMTENHPDLPSIGRADLFPFHPSGLLRSGLKLPQKVLAAWSRYVQGRGDTTLLDLVWLMLEALPAGLYESSGLEKYVRHVLRLGGYSNHFSDLERDLYIIATNLDNGERAVFGRGYHEDVTLSKAVAASAALPLFYKPVRIGANEYVDGGLRGNASLDLAIEQGATLVVCINPIVPFDNEVAPPCPAWRRLAATSAIRASRQSPPRSSPSCCTPACITMSSSCVAAIAMSISSLSSRSQTTSTCTSRISCVIRRA